ncbi:adenylyl-sulfate kinase [Pseudomonas sp. LRF_L74]|uniref:adenylyl-sulfate kinase n=1 Tax=Pseudomonas sp. LRF_L74 TaxID=3369422 RepID=UPI003F625712
MSTENILTAVPHSLGRQEREQHYGHAGAVLWLTGLSASGKSSLAMALERALTALGYSCYVLDGDNLRHGLNADLGFAPSDRTENIRRAGQVAALFADAGLICIAAFISPYAQDREQARLAAAPAFHEVYIEADLPTCEARDPKGLYRRARSGALPGFTGIDAPYEVPLSPELTIHSGTSSLPICLARLIEYVTLHIPLKQSG